MMTAEDRSHDQDPKPAPAEGEDSAKPRLAWRDWARRIGQRFFSASPKQPIWRYLGHLGILLLIVLGALAARWGLGRLPQDSLAGGSVLVQALAAGDETQQQGVSVDLPAFSGGGAASLEVSRLLDVHTTIPTRPRMTIAKYVVQQGDTLFGIAEKFGLKPQSILWGNWITLQADPHTLSPGQELDIPPVDGVIHVWSSGEGLNGVAEFYGVTSQDIIDWPGNDLDPEIDPANPGIPAGTLLVVPGGRRELPTWQTPRISRDNPASARVLGPGYCGKVYSGPVGTGTFVWPTATRYISGYHYDPDLHPAIDIGGKLGYAIFASDTGVIVYAGWNDWGYGNVIVIDHGNGWQTLYAHLSQINVVCGQAVFQGNVIGAMGSTGNSSGPHLHFEMMSDRYGKVNPLDFLP